MSLIHIAHNAVDAKLLDADRETQLFVQKVLSYNVQGAETMSAFKSGHWNGRSSFYEMRNQKFPAGFVYLVQDRLTKLGHTVSIARTPLPEPLGPVRPIFDEFGYKDSNYDYQPRAVDRLVKHGMVIAQIATGGGKSRVAQMAVARIQRPTLFLTTRGVLMYQMHDHFTNLFKGLAKYEPGFEHFSDYKVGIVGDGINDPRKMVTVGMVQTFAQRIKEHAASIRHLQSELTR